MGKDYSVNFLDIVSYLLMIICFPVNPLVLFNLIEPQGKDILTILGIFIWSFGMVLVIYPFVYFKIKGDVRKGKSYVHTNRIVTSGFYSVIRHVQYTGGILSIFFATPLLYPHWIFISLGIPGIFLTYLGSKREDRLLIEKFGKDYLNYMEKVPSMNIFAGVYRLLF